MFKNMWRYVREGLCQDGWWMICFQQIIHLEKIGRDWIGREMHSNIKHFCGGDVSGNLQAQ